MERLKWIDIAKGIGVLLVIAGHMHAMPTVIKNFIYGFHMPLFFMLAGYCFKDKYLEQSGEGYVLHKVRTILVPCLGYVIGFSIFDIILYYIIQPRG